MKHLSLIIFIFFASFSLSLAQETVDPYAHFEGEKIQYQVRSMAAKVGEATLEFKGKTTVNGKEAYLISFKATSMNFLDIEKIYADTSQPTGQHRR